MRYMRYMRNMKLQEMDIFESNETSQGRGGGAKITEDRIVYRGG